MTTFTFDETNYLQGRWRSNNFKPIEYLVEGECWICVSHRLGASGYARIRRYGKYTRVHRYVFEVTNGTKIKPGNIIMHSCDRPNCINPSHLSEGTQVENMADMKDKGRSTKGSKSWSAILTEREVWEIKHLLEFTRFQQKEIAEFYLVKPNVIYLIKKKVTWSHVTL